MISRKTKMRLLSAVLGTAALSGGAYGVVRLALDAGLAGATRPATEAVAQSQGSDSTVPAPANPPAEYGAPATRGLLDGNPGASLVAINELAGLAYRLNDQQRQSEQSEYGLAAVEKKVRATLAALGRTNVEPSGKIISFVYNLVQMFDASNEQHIAAWRSDRDLLNPNDREYGIIYFDGGPAGGPQSNNFGQLRNLYSARAFYFNQPQFMVYAKQYVGRFGAGAQGNPLLDRLVSSDEQRLDAFKKLYDQGRLEGAAMLLVVGGQLDMNAQEMAFATSMANAIVTGGRLKGLVRQLKQEGYERVGILGLSYGYFAALEGMLTNPELMEDVYGANVGENLLTQSQSGLPRDPGALSGQPVDYNVPLDKNYLALTHTLDTRPWVRAVLAGPYGQQFKDKLEVQNAADDAVFAVPAAVYANEQAFWESVGVRYTLYPFGGHNRVFDDHALIGLIIGVPIGTARRY